LHKKILWNVKKRKIWNRVHTMFVFLQLFSDIITWVNWWKWDPEQNNDCNYSLQFDTLSISIENNDKSIETQLAHSCAKKAPRGSHLWPLDWGNKEKLLNLIQALMISYLIGWRNWTWLPCQSRWMWVFYFLEKWGKGKNNSNF